MQVQCEGIFKLCVNRRQTVMKIDRGLKGPLESAANYLRCTHSHAMQDHFSVS